MRLLVASQSTLNELRQAVQDRPTAVLRVAHQWALRVANAQYDLMARLAVLEGAAGVSEGRWSENPSRGVRAAADAFAQDSLHPEWLTKFDTGMYRTILSIVEKTLKRSDLQDVTDLTAEDIMIQALLGLSRLGPELFRDPKRREQMSGGPLYLSGKGVSAKIKSGQESPQSMGKGKAGGFTRNKALDEIRNYKARKEVLLKEDVGEVSSGRGVEDKGLWHKSKQEFLVEVVFSDDQLGVKIRNWVSSFLGRLRGVQSKYLTWWFEQSMEERRALTQKEVAAHFGKRPEGMSTYFRKGLGDLQKAFWRSPLTDELEEQFIEEGGRLASTNRVAVRVALRWAFRQFFSPPVG